MKIGKDHQISCLYVLLKISWQNPNHKCYRTHVPSNHQPSKKSRTIRTRIILIKKEKSLNAKHIWNPILKNTQHSNTLNLKPRPLQLGIYTTYEREYISLQPALKMEGPLKKLKTCVSKRQEEIPTNNGPTKKSFSSIFV